MFAASDIAQLWHEATDNSRLTLTSVGLGLLVAFCFFKPIFGDRQGFWECVKFWLLPDIIALIRGQGLEDGWSKLKLFFWLALSAGATILAFHELPVRFPGFVTQPTFQNLVGPPHVYQLAKPPKFLSDDLAIGDAQATMASENFDRLAWHPLADGRTTAPDGQKDIYLSRSAFNPNHGTIVFTNNSHSRIVAVQLDGNQIICQISVGK